MKHKA